MPPFNRSWLNYETLDTAEVIKRLGSTGVRMHPALLCKVVFSKPFTQARFWNLTATAGSDVVQSGRQFSMTFPTFCGRISAIKGCTNIVFQMVKRLWLIRIDQ
ncbi:hypothetical protein TNCV_3180171 [Trichonephila clavipes]|nr:hypothetical protein TNCV_3180171 [Trichonephila clavipes]